MQRYFGWQHTLLTVILAQSLSLGLAQAQTPTGAQLLQAMSHAEQMVQYSGTETVKRQGAPTITMRIWHSGAKRRVEFLAPPIMYGDLLVNDGTELVSYHRSEKAATRMRATAIHSNDIYGGGHLGNGFEAKVLGTATVAGRPAWIVVVSPSGRSQPVSKFWIDHATKTRLRVEHYSGAGALVRTAALQTISFGPVPATHFQWTPPPGVKVTQTSGTLYNGLDSARQAASWIQYPHYVPTGYAFESAIVDPKGEAWLRYTNGLNRFSIFQQRTTGSTDTQLRRVSGAWYWQREGSRFLAVGVPTTEATQLTQSIH